MTKMTIAVGCDHGGAALKFELLQALKKWGWEVTDLGCFALSEGGARGLAYDEQTGTLSAAESADYPDYATRVAQEVKGGRAQLGLLICGSGVGMSIAANKVRGIRAALCHDPYSAAMTRAHNDANVLCMGGRVVGPELAKEVLRAFLAGAFEGGRHQRRVDKIGQIEDEQGEP
jgi:ribose 5-phosphate isomerase B